MILDLFAGLGGWTEGLRLLGTSDIGVEIDKDSCLTRTAAGHHTIRGDVTRLPIRPGPVQGLIASPPCTDFSNAGKRAGRLGETGQLIDAVPLIAAQIRPRWIACEQVPPCLDIWREHATYYRGLGYRTWCGVLNAADYGVPQTRKRAFLLASLDIQPDGPAPTHARAEQTTLFEHRDRWVTMAEALGWDTVPRESRVGWSPADWILDRPGTTVVARKDKLMPPGWHDEWFHDSVDISSWPMERPSSTIVGSFAPDIVAPGTRGPEFVSRQLRPGSVRISIEQALTLQSFRTDYPLRGSPTSRWKQVGNAVPPVPAAAVLRQLIR